MGAAVCAAAGVGIYGDLDTAVERMIRYSSVTPQASFSEYTEAYRRWLTQGFHRKLLVKTKTLIALQTRCKYPLIRRFFLFTGAIG